MVQGQCSGRVEVHSRMILHFWSLTRALLSVEAVRLSMLQCYLGLGRCVPNEDDNNRMTHVGQAHERNPTALQYPPIRDIGSHNVRTKICIMVVQTMHLCHTYFRLSL